MGKKAERRRTSVVGAAVSILIMSRRNDALPAVMEKLPACVNTPGTKRIKNRDNSDFHLL